METKTVTMTIDEILEDEKACPLPIGIIPDRMGINLCCVKNISWERREDRQLVNLTINFIPNDEDYVDDYGK